ncbi:MAG: hypothetical protein ISR64_11055 [Deltaproteobacteria bacterium]|nr:hypothetical protein [Deltaproteobacteria bacterium]
MSIEEYGRRSKEAISSADASSDALEKAAIRFEAAGDIPRFPSLAPLHLGLLLPLMEEEFAGVAPGLLAEAGVMLVRSALLVGARDLAEEVTTYLESETRAADEPRLAGHASLARSMMLITEGRAPGARVELEKARGSCTEATDWIWQDVVEVALLLTEKNEPEAEERANDLLNSLDPWPLRDGERYDTCQKLAYVFMSQDRVDHAIEILERARQLASTHGLASDAGTCLVSLVPMFMVAGQTDRALELMEEALKEVAGPDGSPELEMTLRGLQMKALEARGELAEGLRVGFEALERSREHGTVDDYTEFIIHMAAMYQAGGSPVDAYHLMALAESGLVGRGDATDQVETLQHAIEALRTDLGDEEFRRVIVETHRLDPDLGDPDEEGPAT